MKCDPSTYKNYLNKYHPHSREFHQAVAEVFQDVWELFEENRVYQNAQIMERLMEPDRIISFRVTWEDDSGKIHINRAFRVQYSNVLGAYKGGLRFHSGVNESILKFLGFEQCYKNALTGLPMGGAKGGSDFNPKEFSDREVMRFCQAFMTELYKYVGPDIDVPAGDMNVGTREIGYLYGQYLRITDRWEGVLTGKSPGFGGSCGRSEATGHGVVYFLKEALNAHDNGLSDKSVLVSGSGNVALYAAEKCIEEGAKVLTLSDSEGTLYFKSGLNLEQLEEIMQSKFVERKRLSECGQGEFFSEKKPWDIKDAHIALPCATQNEVNIEDAKSMISNKIIAIAEGANMPLTHEAQDAVLSKPIIYAPGKAANAGGVAVSGLERSQNATLESWSKEKVDDKLRTIMKEIHTRSIEHVEKEKGILPYRKGANIYGFKRLADTLLAYGIH